MLTRALPFRQVWLVDFEFVAAPGERPIPICLVARELASNRTVRLWGDELQQRVAPYPIDRDCLFVAYYASAELGCHLALGWPLPVNILDLFIEFRNRTNGKGTPSGSSLLGALACYGLDAINAVEKDTMRQLALRGAPWTAAERRALLAYCESDVIALAKLLPHMLPDLDLERALLRGRFMTAAARIEHVGIPIDTLALSTLRAHWATVQERLIARIDADYGVFANRSFKVDAWAQWLSANKIPWPRLLSGALALDDDTFREMARAYPTVAPIRELRVSLSQMRLEDLAVGADGRNRCLLSAFRAKTGRNQPSNAQFIFGPAVWLRSLIRPEPDQGLVYIDWSQHELGIAAALSGDGYMMAAYESGDPYLAFARQAGAAPRGATKATHAAIREQFKACALAVQYGMGPEALAERIGQTPVHARELLRLHQETYRTFWKWSDAAVDYAMLYGSLSTVFGWTLHTGSDANVRSIRNFPMQANGAEMLRLACCFLTERGIRVCAPVHDAVLIEAPLDDLEAVVDTAQQAMAEASSIVLGGFELRSEATIIRHPARYVDLRGTQMWMTVWEVLADLGLTTACAPVPIPPAHQCDNTCAPVPIRPLLSLSSQESLKK